MPESTDENAGAPPPAQPPAPAEPAAELPAFKFSPKKVDDSWKEEARREREAVARAVSGARPGAANPAGAAAVPAPTSAGAAPAAPGAAQAGAAAPAVPLTPEGKPQTAAEQQQTKIFLAFVEQMAQQALMQLGEMENPYTGQAEVDIQGARYTLELLATIAVKTKGNLTEPENKALNTILHELRNHYTAVAQELQRQMAAQMAQQGARKPGPGGTLR